MNSKLETGTKAEKKASDAHVRLIDDEIGPRSCFPAHPARLLPCTLTLTPPSMHLVIHARRQMLFTEPHVAPIPA